MTSSSDDSPHTNDTAADRYGVFCTVCGLDTECTGLDAVLELADTHQDLYGDLHIVEFERLDGHSARDEE